MNSDVNSELGVFYFIVTAVAASIASHYLCERRRDKCCLQKKVVDRKAQERTAIPPAPKQARQPSVNISLLGDSVSIKGNRLEG